MKKHKNIQNVWRHLAAIFGILPLKKLPTVASVATTLESF